MASEQRTSDVSKQAAIYLESLKVSLEPQIKDLGDKTHATYRGPFEDKEYPPGTQLQFDPGHCLFTNHRRTMYYYYHIGGSWALSAYLYRYADNEKTKGSDGTWSWDYFIKDKNSKTNDLLFLISTMHPEVVKGLICGNLTYRLQTDGPFATLVRKTIPRVTTPGIYIHQWFDSGSDPNVNTQGAPARLPDKGKAFSAEQLQKLYDCTGVYLKQNSATSLQYAKSIDSLFQHSSEKENLDYDNDINARRYLRSKEHREHLEEWRSCIKREVLDRARGQPDWNKQCLWSFCSVGIGANCFQRSLDHLANHSTSKLFGLMNAMIKHEFPQFSVESHQVLYLTSLDQADLAEALVSVLSSSYHDMGGFNAQRGGKTGYETKSFITAHAGIKQNIEFMIHKGDFPRYGGYKWGLAHQKQKTKDLDRYLLAKQMGTADNIRASTQSTFEALNSRKEQLMKRWTDVRYAYLRAELDEQFAGVQQVLHERRIKAEKAGEGEEDEGAAEGNESDEFFDTPEG